MTGGTIDHYEILEKLGEGGIGIVYKARDTRLGRLVALKRLPLQGSGDGESLRRFTREAQTASSLNHPNIVTIHDIAIDHGEPYIVMELVLGKTLDQLIPRRGMCLADVLNISVQMADALAAAAAAGLIHRDVKPANVMVTEAGQVKILDFGLAKLSERVASEQTTAVVNASGDEYQVTKEGTVIGTVSYMSPEQAQGKPLDPRSDIFSFGAVIYEMVTGQRPFRGESSMSIVSAILREEPAPAGQLCPDIPRDLEKIIARCLRKDPARRFQNIADARVALLELKEESDSGKLGVVTPMPAMNPKWLWVIALGVLGLMVIAFLVLRSPIGTSSSVAQPRLTPFTSYITQQDYPAFSPDGNQIAFCWSGDKDQPDHVYVKLIGTEAPLQLTSAEAQDSAPAWAPGGTAIAFHRRFSDGTGGIYQIPALGGSEHRITDLRRGPTTRISWSPDGKWILASGIENPAAPSHIWRISTETGEKDALYPDEKRSDQSPALSPDGHTLAFSRSLGDINLGLFIVNLDRDFHPSGSPIQVSPPGALNYDAAWTSDGDIVFLRSAARIGSLWRVTPSGKTPAKQLDFGADGVGNVAISGSHRRLAFTRASVDTNVWQIPVHGPGKLGQPQILIASARGDGVRQGAFSPDSKKIAFESDRAGVVSVWVAQADGSKPTLIASNPDYLSGSPAWSPDGKQIAFDSRRGKQAAIYAVSADGGAPRRLFSDISWDHIVPSWSKDGKWVYFNSERTGRFEVYKAPAAGGEPVPVTRNGGFGAIESADGRFIYYSRTRGSANTVSGATSPLMRMSVDGGPETQVVDAVYQRSWVVTGEGVWFLWPVANSGIELRYHDLETRRTSVAASIGVPANVGLAISPDGHALVYTQIDHQSSEIVLVENFR